MDQGTKPTQKQGFIFDGKGVFNGMPGLSTETILSRVYWQSLLSFTHNQRRHMMGVMTLWLEWPRQHTADTLR